MNKKDLYKSVGMIDEELINEADLTEVTARVKKFKPIKVALIAASLTLVIGITAWASSVIFSGTVSSTIKMPTYKHVVASETVEKDFGFKSNLIDEFSNNYKFKVAYTTNSEDFGENGESTQKYESLTCDYVYGDSKLMIKIDEAKEKGRGNGTVAETYKDTALMYNSQTYKFVPADYDLTVQDKEDEKSGKFVFSYGTDEVEISQQQFIGWTYNNVNYSISASDSTLSQEDFVSMAKEIIDYQNK